MDELFHLNDTEKLQKHQLEVADYWSNKKHSDADTTEDITVEPVERPSRWSMTQGVNLYSWQKDCLTHYQGNGVVKVVTGAGKTLFALALAEQLQGETQNLKVLIVVPTIVLMNQWFDVIQKHSNLPDTMIGRLGGGYSDALIDHDILIGVCNSVSTKANEIGTKYQDRLLFIADECHMYTGAVMSKIFSIGRKYSLGLSATPDSGDDATVPEVITQALGSIFYTLNYDDAVHAGFLPEFEIRHIGLPLSDHEQIQYNRLSREITDLRNDIFERFPDAPRGGDLTGWAGMMLAKGNVNDSAAASCGQYISKVSERKDLIYHAHNRELAVIRFLKERLEKEPGTQVIMFHERIKEVMRLYALLLKEGIAAVPEHSELSDSLRTNSIELFRKGIAKVIVSGKALIQGFDAPAADCGINAAASGSQTQAIQSIGRILRKNGDGQDGLILRFYIRNTTDENIYRKINFSTITGAKRNRYYFWDPSQEDMGIFDQEKDGPPQSPKPENGIDWSVVQPGEERDFDADGEDFQIDNGNNIFRKIGRKKEYAENPQNILKLLEPFREIMRNNYIRQTSSGRIFLRQEHGDIWTWLYCGKLDQQICFQNRQSPIALPEKSYVDSSKEEFQIKQAHGRLTIQQKKFVNNRKLAIRPPLDEEIFAGIEQLPCEVSQSIKDIYIIDGVNVFCLNANQEYKICVLSKPWNQQI